MFVDHVTLFQYESITLVSLPFPQLMMSSGSLGTPFQSEAFLGYSASGRGTQPPWTSVNLQNSPPLNRYVFPLWAQTKAASTFCTTLPSWVLMPHSDMPRGYPGRATVSLNTQKWEPKREVRYINTKTTKRTHKISQWLNDHKDNIIFLNRVVLSMHWEVTRGRIRVL